MCNEIILSKPLAFLEYFYNLLNTNTILGLFPRNQTHTNLSLLWERGNLFLRGKDWFIAEFCRPLYTKFPLGLARAPRIYLPIISLVGVAHDSLWLLLFPHESAWILLFLTQLLMTIFFPTDCSLQTCSFVEIWLVNLLGCHHVFIGDLKIFYFWHPDLWFEFLSFYLFIFLEYISLLFFQCFSLQAELV